MYVWHAFGFVAAALVIAAFCMEDILHLRIVALASNIAFFTYGLGLGLMPVWLLHLALLPINLYRLWQVNKTVGKHSMEGRVRVRVGVRRASVRYRVRSQRIRPIDAASR